jgi:F0F1-type ATP synthase membrane subunit c/vacuolar-type H+-ATPase subunit K
VAVTPTSTDDEAQLPATATGTEVVPVDDGPTPDGARRPWYRRLDKKLILASAAIAVGLVMIGYALTSAVTGNEAAHMPAAVEEVTPVFDAMQVPQQATVIADLAAGYEGRLIVDGVELPTIRQDQIGNIDIKPGEQIAVPPGAIYEPGNATLTFTPGDGQAIDNFDEGRHTVTVIYWKILDGPDVSRSYSWSFTTV